MDVLSQDELCMRILLMPVTLNVVLPDKLYDIQKIIDSIPNQIYDTEKVKSVFGSEENVSIKDKLNKINFKFNISYGAFESMIYCFEFREKHNDVFSHIMLHSYLFILLNDGSALADYYDFIGCFLEALSVLCCDKTSSYSNRRVLLTSSFFHTVDSIIKTNNINLLLSISKSIFLFFTHNVDLSDKYYSIFTKLFDLILSNQDLSDEIFGDIMTSMDVMIRVIGSAFPIRTFHDFDYILKKYNNNVLDFKIINYIVLMCNFVDDSKELVMYVEEYICREIMRAVYSNTHSLYQPDDCSKPIKIDNNFELKIPKTLITHKTFDKAIRLKTILYFLKRSLNRSWFP